MADGWQGIRLSFRSDVRYLEPLRTVVRESLDLVGLEGETAADVVLAVQEGCTNVIRHCYQGRPNGRIDLVLSFSEEALEIRIDDYGKFVDPARIKGRDLDDVRPGGLGVHLMRKVMDSVEYTANAWGGTTLTMVKRRPVDEPAKGSVQWDEE